MGRHKPEMKRHHRAKARRLKAKQQARRKAKEKKP
jgi:hypothetical protein